jgi:hypothetical protein
MAVKGDLGFRLLQDVRLGEVVTGVTLIRDLEISNKNG